MRVVGQDDRNGHVDERTPGCGRACVQVFFLKGHLFAMLSVAIVQAILAVTFFMHLGAEKPTLRLALIPGTLFVLVMMNMIWADSFRLMTMKPFAK